MSKIRGKSPHNKLEASGNATNVYSAGKARQESQVVPHFGIPSQGLRCMQVWSIIIMIMEPPYYGDNDGQDLTLLSLVPRQVDHLQGTISGA